MKKKLRHQPRIKDVSRIPKVSSLHPLVQNGLEVIARKENKSYSWVIAEIVSDFFGIDCETGVIVNAKKTHIKLVKRA